MPPLLRSNAYSYIVQGISTPRARHQHASFKASARLVPGIPTNGSRYSRHPSPTQAGRHVARCSVAVHNEALFFLYLYLYLYIYKYIYKYKISFRHLALLDKQLQHCNAARNCAESLFMLGVKRGYNGDRIENFGNFSLKILGIFVPYIIEDMDSRFHR